MECCGVAPPPPCPNRAIRDGPALPLRSCIAAETAPQAAVYSAKAWKWCQRLPSSWNLVVVSSHPRRCVPFQRVRGTFCFISSLAVFIMTRRLSLSLSLSRRPPTAHGPTRVSPLSQWQCVVWPSHRSLLEQMWVIWGQHTRAPHCVSLFLGQESFSVCRKRKEKENFLRAESNVVFLLWRIDPYLWQ